jgi:hypothetical protein
VVKTRANTALAAEVLLMDAIAAQIALVALATEISLSGKNFAHSFVGFLRIYRFGGFFLFKESRA